MRHPVVIVGGGLAGLYAARQLHAAGIPIQLLEGRDRLGGRVLSVDASGSSSPDGFDLGPSWFWPTMQPEMAGLIQELGLSAFPQQHDGDALYQGDARGAPQRHSGLQEQTVSMRLAGGMGTIIAGLRAELPPSSVQLNAEVTHLALLDKDVAVTFSDRSGGFRTIRATRVVVALPPRLIGGTMAFSPPMGAAVVQQWRRTPTWMAPHAKFFALYDRPFWREAGLSGRPGAWWDRSSRYTMPRPPPGVRRCSDS